MQLPVRMLPLVEQEAEFLQISLQTDARMHPGQYNLGGGEEAGVAVLCAGDERLRGEEGENRHGIPCRGGGVAAG